MLSSLEWSQEGGSLKARMSLVLRMEWTLLMLRYVTYVLLAAVSVAVEDTHMLRVLLAAGASALAHNLFAHWVLYRHRYTLFVSPINFTLYLLRFCLLLAITGGEQSPFSPLLLFLIIGYHLYTPRAAGSLWVTLLVGAGYSFTVLGGWLIGGMDLIQFPVYITLAAIGACGYIMNRLARLLLNLERDARRHAVALSSSEATLRAILNHTAHAIVVYGENELITEVNDSACKFLGLPRERVIGARFQAYLFDDGTLQETMNELRETGVLNQEMLVLPPGSGERNVFMHVHSFLRENTRFYVALFHDITDMKEFQEATRLAKYNLEQVNRELKRVADLRTAFYADVANRLRSPVAAILGFTDMLLNEELGGINAEQREALYSCKRGLLRMFSLLNESFAPASGASNNTASRITGSAWYSESDAEPPPT